MTHAYYKCDCGHRIGLPSMKIVTGVSCGNCDRFWKIHFNPNKLLGTVSEWRCPTCNSQKGVCRRVPRWCEARQEKAGIKTSSTNSPA